MSKKNTPLKKPINSPLEPEAIEVDQAVDSTDSVDSVDSTDSVDSADSVHFTDSEQAAQGDEGKESPIIDIPVDIPVDSPAAEAAPQVAQVLSEEEESWKLQYMRLCADFENYKKRTRKEQVDFLLHAESALIKDLLPVIDDLARGLEAGTAEESSKEHLIEGFDLTYQKLAKLLHDKGLEGCEPSIGSAFDSDLHEAVTQLPSEDIAPGAIVQLVEKGYAYKEKILRYAKVITASQK